MSKSTKSAARKAVMPSSSRGKQAKDSTKGSTADDNEGPTDCSTRARALAVELRLLWSKHCEVEHHLVAIAEQLKVDWSERAGTLRDVGKVVAAELQHASDSLAWVEQIDG